MEIYDLRIEYRTNPEGLAVKQPRFSWKIASEEKNVVQTSWHLTVVCEGNTVWDSGSVDSSQSVLIPYAGKDLDEEEKYEVTLQIEDNYGNQAQASASFTTGIFDVKHFQAKMITHDFPEEEVL